MVDSMVLGLEHSILAMTLGMGKINNNGWCGHQFRLVDTYFLSFTNSVGRSAQTSTKYIVIEAGIEIECTQIGL